MRKLLFLGVSLGLGACATPSVPARKAQAPAAPATEQAKATDESTSTAASEDATPTAEQKPAITITLLEAGEEPRIPLRIQPQLNQTFTVTQETHTEVTTRIDGKTVAQATLPIVVQTITYKTTDVQADRVTLTWTANMEAKSGPGVDPSALQKMKSQLAQAKAIEGKSVFNLRGVLLENDVDHNNPELLSALSHLWSPFPEEAVGKGATWKTEHVRMINGFEATESTVYAIDDIGGGLVVTSADANTQGKPGPFLHPDLPPGATIDLKSMEGSSSKRTEIRNNAFFQDASTQNSQLTTVLSMKNQGKTQEIVTETTLKIKSKTVAK